VPVHAPLIIGPIIVKAAIAVAVLALPAPGGNGFVGYPNMIMALQ
jgi:hypothetical protein